MDALILHGQVRCTSCGFAGMASWRIVRHKLPCPMECGGECVPEGLQVKEAVPEIAMIDEMIRIELAALRKGMS